MLTIGGGGSALSVGVWELRACKVLGSGILACLRVLDQKRLVSNRNHKMQPEEDGELFRNTSEEHLSPRC